MTKEFVLSNFVFNSFDAKEDRRFIWEKHVKEFIRLLKEKTRTPKTTITGNSWCDGYNQCRQEIDYLLNKIAGKSLI